jgi:hypothetical protein
MVAAETPEGKSPQYPRPDGSPLLLVKSKVKEPSIDPLPKM